jgi:hypothetical protein
MFDDDDYDELNLFYDDDNDNENGDWVNNYKEQEQEQQQSILPSQQDNNDNDNNGVNNVNTVDDGVINLDDDDDEPHIQPQYQRQHYIKKSNRNANTHIRSQRVGTLKHHNDNGGDNDSDCVIEIEKSEMTKHLEAKYENKCKIKMLTMDETKQLANERVKHKNDQAMIKEAKRKKYKTIPSNMSFNAFTGKFEQIKTAFDEAIEKEFEDSKYFIPQPQYTTTNTSNTKHNITTTTISDTLQHQQQHKRNYNYNYNYKTHYNNNKDETNSTSDKSSHCSQMKFLNKKHNNNNKHTATHSDYSFSDNEYKSNNNTNTVNRSYNNNHNHTHTHKQYIPKDNINNNNPSCCTIDMTQLKYDIIKQIYTKDNHCRKDLMILFKQIKHYIHNRSTFNHHYTSLLHDHLSTPSHLDQLYSIGTFLYKTLCHHILSAAFPPKALSLTNNTMWRASDIPPIINDINTRTKP